MRGKEGIKEDDVMMMCREGRKEAGEERYAGIFALEVGLNSSSKEAKRVSRVATCAQPTEKTVDRESNFNAVSFSVLCDNTREDFVNEMTT